MSTLNVRRAALLAAHPSPTLDLRFMDGGGLDPRITFTRASVANYFDVAGTLQSAASGAPRFDYDPVTHAPRALLIEEARTNLLLNSATLGTQSVTVTAAATTLSFYGTGTVTLSGTFAGSLVGSGVFPTRSTLTFTPTAGSLTCTVTGSVLNAQVETGAFATSWISTAGASATRAADVATMPVAGWFNAAAMCLAVEGTMQQATAAGTSAFWATLDDGTTANRLCLMCGAGVARIAAVVANGGVVSQSQTNLLNLSVPASFKYAGQVVNSQYASCGNGGAVDAAPGAQPSGINRLAIGQGGSTQINGYIRRVRYWPRSLSSSELQSVTR